MIQVHLFSEYFTRWKKQQSIHVNLKSSVEEVKKKATESF